MPKLADHARRRREIIEALWRITVRGGLGAATFREVAAEAGVSVRLVQYYFGTKAELLHAANRAIGDEVAERALRRVGSLGRDARPRELLRAVLREFIPSDRTRRDAMLLFTAFATAQMTDPSLARADSVSIPRELVEFILRQLYRARTAGEVRADVDAQQEAVLLAAAVPGLTQGVLLGFLTGAQAERALDYALDRLVGPAPVTRARATPRAPRRS